MSSTYSITEGQANFPKMVNEVQAGYIATITKRDETVAYVVGKERMCALIETMEILANPAAMKAIRDYEAGKMKFFEIEDIPD
jgi:antitoxin (DNA-binding transcriptional repressor) of toxin-antitoxin stability system